MPGQVPREVLPGGACGQGPSLLLCAARSLPGETSLPLGGIGWWERLSSHRASECICRMPKLLSQQVVLGKAAQFSLPAEAEVGSLTSGHSCIHVCAHSNARVYN